MSQEQQNIPEVQLGSMGNGANFNFNGQDPSMIFSNNGMMSSNGAPMMGHQQYSQSPLMQPHGGAGIDPQQQQQQHDQHHHQQQQVQLNLQPQNDQDQSNQQQQQQHQSIQQTNQHQQQQSNQQQGFNFNDIKRLQQMQQFGGQGGGSQNALLGNMAGQQQAMNQQAMLLQSMQSMLDQKVQNPLFDNNPVFNPMFQPGLMQDARLLMTQGQMPMAMQNIGEVPLPSPHSLFHRDGTRRMRG